MTQQIAKHFDRSQLPAAVAAVVNTLGSDDLSHGVSGGFPIVSFRGSKWRIRAKGEDTLVTDAEGEAKTFIDVVILKASRAISKTYYASAYEEGADEAPTCVSVNGTGPDANSASPQAKTCAACPHNVWGSKITSSGKKAKACADSRRIAVVPAGDILNEAFGGPMLLRVPAASLDDLAKYGRLMEQKGYPYNVIVTRIGFDTEASYPKLTFKAVRPLDDAQITDLNTVYADMERIDRILTEAQELPFSAQEAPQGKPIPAKQPEPEPEPVFLDEPAPAPAAPARKKRAAAAPKPAPAPEPVFAEGDEEEEELPAAKPNLQAVPAPAPKAASFTGDTLSDALDDLLADLGT